MTIAATNPSFAAGTDLTWSESNLRTLASLDKSAIAQLIDDLPPSGQSVVRLDPTDIGEFIWVDLEHDGKYHLLLTQDVNGRAFYNALLIYTRDAAGRLASQEIRGSSIQDLPKIVRDINGDGKDELIIPTELVSHSTAATTTYPAVYRLENGKYVEASRDFPGFYEDKALPKVTREIEDTHRDIDKIGTSASPLELQAKQSLQGKLADLITERDKILRLTGREPTAGLEDARKWMSSDNPDLLQDAALTFEEIGGHQDEARAAGEAYLAHTYHGR